MTENVWEYMHDDGITESMRLCGCDDKYISGNASDFEKFREWKKTLALFGDNEYARDCCEKLCAAIGESLTFEQIEKCSAEYIWQKYASANRLNDELIYFECGDEKDNYKPSFEWNNITDDFFNEMTDIISYKALITGECEETKKLGVPIHVSFFDGEFKRPDRYSAKTVIEKNHRGEKCNNMENNLLLCQLVCEIIYAEKSNTVKFAFELSNGSECVAGLLKYLVMRALPARIYLIVDSRIPPKTVKEICLLGNRECFVTPLLQERDLQYLCELKKTYPIGLVGIIPNARTESVE